MWCLQKAYQFIYIVLFLLNFQANLSSSSSASSSITQLCSQYDAAALVQFKSSISITAFARYSACDDVGMKSYPRTDSWKQGTDCCSWDGVTCDDIKGHVIGLDLSCSWLYGSIPSNSSLFHLSHLQKLNLAFNYFPSSNMSSKFGEFSSLVYLNLSYSAFAGQVPSQVSHLSKLVSLDLSWTFRPTLDKHTLEGLVHNLTGVRQLLLDAIDMSSINPNVLMNLSSSLRILSLNFCGLKGKFPGNIFHLPNLKLLNLGDNGLSLSLSKLNWSNHLEFLELKNMSFSGELFDPISNLPSLKHLDLSKSSLSGSIPSSLGNLSQLSYLDLSHNSLRGHIPSSLTNLKQLQFLSLAGNLLEGSIPDEVSSFPNLILLDLSDNLLSGTLPSWLYTISSLQYIYLSNNQFSGHIKEFQYNSPVDIELQYNKLQGPVPSSLSQLVNLTDIHLSENNLTGIVEFDMFSKLQNLRFLDLSYNNLSLNSKGTSADYTLPNLQSLHLSSCNVSEFPQFLRGSNHLQHLDLSDNRIYGKIPQWILDVGKDSLSYLNLSHNSLTYIEQLSWKEIQFLDLSSNLIHGDLPIPPLVTNVFFISNNSFSGEISSLICNVSSLAHLDISHNNLSGIIPQCFGILSKSLVTLNLRKNQFHGIIPPTFTEGCGLMNLNLNGNQLEGPLTLSIVNCRSLEVLDLGHNKINDTFPYWLGSLPQLQVLVLRSNQLRGSIRDTRSNLSFPKIQIFDLSSNYFIGTVPVRYITNFKAMINLTENESAKQYMGVVDSRSDRFYSYSIGIALKGVEMEMVKIFTMLTSIDLSNNMFQGEIPKIIGELNSLKGLNLSHNNLNGCIPATIGNLHSLEWLDLSSNKLIGTIPERLLDVTSLSIFNVSENQLEGEIPQGKQFNTFGNDSYEGNKGLCGFPVSKGCNPSEPPPSSLLEEDDSKLNIAFGWKIVLTGYGCGVVFGLAMGYVVFQTGKPKWFVTLVEDQHNKRQKMLKISNRSHGGRRI